MKGEAHMIHIALCDDSDKVLSRLEDYIANMNITDISYDSFGSGVELLNYMEKNSIKYQIYILDISMPDLTGIETAEIIRKSDKDCIIIYLTSYKEFVYQVFRSLPFRFLEKEINEHTFIEVLTEAIQHIHTLGNLFFFHIERQHFQIPYSDIVYFEAQKRKVRLVTIDNNEYEFYSKIRDILPEVDGILFVQCHVSYIVNMQYIYSLNEKNLSLRNGIHIPISKKYRVNVKMKHLEFVKWRCGKQ
ncbi:MAG: LytR/AlgR family response regulator transcription factor [Bacilli bacterium]